MGWWKRNRRTAMRLVAITTVLGFLLPGVLIYASRTIHGAVDGRSVMNSVSFETDLGDADDGYACDSLGDRAYRCSMERERATDEVIRYRVIVEKDSSCWRGELERGSPADLEQRIDGCTRVGDNHDTGTLVLVLWFIAGLPFAMLSAIWIMWALGAKLVNRLKPKAR